MGAGQRKGVYPPELAPMGPALHQVGFDDHAPGMGCEESNRDWLEQ
jgi:hypothetical protein